MPFFKGEIMDTMEMIAIFVAVVGGFKALEWVIEKITAQHDKSQRIDANTESIEEFKKHTTQEIENLNERVNKAHDYATMALQTLEKNITTALDEQKNDYMEHLKSDKEDYIEGIKRVEASIMEMQAVYQQTVAVMDIKIDNLEKAQNKHNNLIERMYACESKIGVLDNREKVSEHRIDDLEKKI